MVGILVLTHTEDVEAEAVANGLVNQLVRHAVKAHMARQRDSTETFSLLTHTTREAGRGSGCDHKLHGLHGN